MQELGDAEIQELHIAIAGDENVPGLEVTMHYEVAVRVRDRVQHVQEKPYARLNVQILPAAVLVNRLTLDVLEHEIGQRVIEDAGV